MSETIACPNCYGGHNKPCQICGDTGFAKWTCNGYSQHQLYEIRIDKLHSENAQLKQLLERMVEDSFNLIGEYSKFNAMAYRYGRIKTYSQLYEESLAAYEALKASKKI